MRYQNVAVAPLGITLLATLLRSCDVPVVEAYLHFDFDRLLGRQAYARIATHGARNGIAGELVFAETYRGVTRMTLSWMRSSARPSASRPRCWALSRFAPTNCI